MPNEITGINTAYVLDLYDRYKQNPESVDAPTRAFFANWSPPADGGVPSVSQLPNDKVIAAVQLAHAIRAYGHLAARLDPLGSPPRGDPALDLTTHGLTEDELAKLPASLVGGPVANSSENALTAIELLREIYTASIGFDYHHIHFPSERDWLRDAAERRSFSPPNDPINPLGLLDRLSQIEAFERFLHRVFPGKTRFSVEGLDMMVPILDELIGEAAEKGVRLVLIGMAHRGRLNVLTHILGKPYTQILAEFKDPSLARDLAARESVGWTGDVKYHAGASRCMDLGETMDIAVALPPNPSHVESANPIVEGMARAAGEDTSRPGAPHFDERTSLPILIHGDAAFSGQGIVAETLNLLCLDGYQSGGTIHIIANNQLGYTTEPAAARSTLYASDLAKGFEIPIVHVNADDVEACVAVARLASSYRARFHKDFVIDLIGYRRYGHNEGDEPAFTQPLLYEKIAQHATVRQIWAKALISRGTVQPDAEKALVDKYMSQLQAALESLQPERDLVEPVPAPPPPKAAQKAKTGVPVDQLRALNQSLLQLPEGFTPNPKLERAMKKRHGALDNLDEPNVDWALAEQLAFASILADGIPIRLTGEDVERGTFGHRHSVLHDVKTGATWTPLQTIPQAKAAFAVFDSPLTENALLAFEYGYNIQTPERLVLWEAQYGDFINGAQMVIDEFLVSGRAKWGQTPSLTLLLPHGSEGAGPDHSSARMERFLELAAETNMRIAYPTTAAQYFHLIRRQAALLLTDPLPLIVMTPKSLLRHPRSASSLRALSQGRWEPVIDDASADVDAVRRLVFCSGKIYVDAVTFNEHAKLGEVALVRIEQLYPFPDREIRAILGKYKHAVQFVWMQEEPQNMGAWVFVQAQFEAISDGHIRLIYAGRPPNSSPAEGSMSQHMINQKALISSALQAEQQHANSNSRS